MVCVCVCGGGGAIPLHPLTLISGGVCRKKKKHACRLPNSYPPLLYPLEPGASLKWSDQELLVGQSPACYFGHAPFAAVAASRQEPGGFPTLKRLVWLTCFSFLPIWSAPPLSLFQHQFNVEVKGSWRRVGLSFFFCLFVFC